MSREFSPRKLARNAALGLFLAAEISACNATAPTPKPTSSEPTFSPVPTVMATPLQSFDNQPAVTMAPPTPTINPNLKCDQRSVPNAEPVPPVVKEPDPSFKLNVPVLLFHQVTDSIPRSSDNSPTKIFDAQMKILHDNNWKTITMATLAFDMEHQIIPPSKTFVITVDDGHKANEILPILKKYHYLATFFDITGNYIDNWGKNKDNTFLTPSEIKALVAAGDEVSNHTLSHAHLTKQSQSALDIQIDQGAQDIANLTGKWPSSLAYPFGDYNQQVEDAAAACQSDRVAVTTVQGVGEDWAHRFAIPRFTITANKRPSALLKMLAPYAKEKAAA